MTAVYEDVAVDHKVQCMVGTHPSSLSMTSCRAFYSTFQDLLHCFTFKLQQQSEVNHQQGTCSVLPSHCF